MQLRLIAAAAIAAIACFATAPLSAFAEDAGACVTAEDVFYKIEPAAAWVLITSPRQGSLGLARHLGDLYSADWYRARHVIAFFGATAVAVYGFDDAHCEVCSQTMTAGDYDAAREAIGLPPAERSRGPPI